MKKLFVLIISALLCLALITSAFADVTLWDRLDNGDVVAKTAEPTEEEMSNLAPHEHTFGDWCVLEDSTCSEPGLIYQVCSGCGFWNVAKSPRLEHTVSEIVVIREATCIAEGVGYERCEVCGNLQEVEIPTVPHSFGDWEITQETTDHSAGTRQRVCRVCGYTQVEQFDPAGTLRKGARGDAVREIQTLLAQQGFLDRNYVDGDFGDYTERAVTDFQRAINLTSDGVAWPQTIDLLHHEFGEWTTDGEADYYSPAHYERTCSKCGYTEAIDFGIKLQVGDSGENVVELQNRLTELGFNTGYADGVFGEGTRAAVVDYQTAQGFEADGIVWPGVWRALFPETLTDSQ